MRIVLSPEGPAQRFWTAFQDLDRRSNFLFPALIAIFAAAERILWLAVQGISKSHAEALNAAVHFANYSTIGDVYGRGTGASAHLNPVMPTIAGTLYKVFGVGSIVAETMLTAISITFALSAALLLYSAFARLGLSRNARLIALAIACLLPTNMELESIAFRIWEGSLAVFLMALCFWLVVRADDQKNTGWKMTVAISFVAAFALFVNPAVGLTCFGMGFVLMLRTVEKSRWPLTIAICLVSTIVVLTPWSLRNYSHFNKFIPLRSNAGLELAVAYHDGLKSGQSDKTIFRSRMDQIHPSASDSAFNRMQALGEIKYAEAVGQDARAWILANPMIAAKAAFKHAVQYYFPPRWIYQIYFDGGRALEVKIFLAWMFGLFGLIGAVVAALRWRERIVYAALLVVMPVIPYIVVQPVLRYRYLIFAPLIFMSVFLVAKILAFSQQGARSSAFWPRPRVALARGLK